jgi:hypothetical protein
MPIKEWAKQQGVTSRAAYRTAEKPAVRARAAELRRQAIDQAVGRLADAAVTAALTLWDLMSTERPETIRLGAARAVLSALIEVRSHAEYCNRFAEIEKQIQEMRKK